MRKYLRRNEDVIPVVATLLSPETEEKLTTEFASFCTSRLAIEYTGKAQITAKPDVFPSLITLLGSSDPDVQKNSIETLHLLVHVSFSVSQYYCLLFCYLLFLGL